MFAAEDTRVLFIGGACNSCALEAIVRMSDAGYDVVAGEHHPQESLVFDAAGIPMIRSRFEAVEGADVILTCCARPSDVEELYLGEGGLLEIARPGTYLLDLSFVTPKLSKEIHAMAAISELTYVDLPLGPFGEGEQTIGFAGCDRQTFNDISPLLPFLAYTVLPQKEPGQGQLAFAMALIGLAGSLMGTVEALALANLGGIDAKDAMNILARGNAGCRALVEYAPRIEVDKFDGRLSVLTMLDNLDTALYVAEDLGVTLPMTETAYQLYELLSTVGGDEMNLHALALLYADEQTCADHGLDWARAEGMQPPAPGYGDDMGDFGQPGGGIDFGPNGSGGRGYPPAGGFFSPN